MTEGQLLKQIQVGVIDSDIRMFRNNVAKGWIGDSSRLEDGSILIRNPRRLISGLCNGSSDLIGLCSKTITQEMVGQRIATFSALEIKMLNGRLSEQQRNFLEMVNNMGGVSGVARSVNEAKWILKG